MYIDLQKAVILGFYILYLIFTYQKVWNISLYALTATSHILWEIAPMNL